MHHKSGLRKAIDILGHLDGVEAIYLDAQDVVRHRLVKQIIRAYEKLENRQRRGAKAETEEE